MLFLQEEADQLRRALAEEKHRNEQMLQLLQGQLQDPRRYCSTLYNNIQFIISLPSSECEGRRMTGEGPSHQECENVIRLLQKEKEQKVHEVCGMA